MCRILTVLVALLTMGTAANATTLSRLTITSLEHGLLEPAGPADSLPLFTASLAAIACANAAS
jgi:hypothetical protein